MKDEYGWTDCHGCSGCVIGYEEVRLQQGDVPEDVVALVHVGEPPRSGVINANPVYLTAEQAVETALVLLDAAALGRACLDPEGPPKGPVADDDHNRRWRLHVHAASIKDFTFWVEKKDNSWLATEIESGVTALPGTTVEEAMTNYFKRNL